MSEESAIVPFVAQAEPVQRSKEFEPRLLAEQYGRTCSVFCLHWPKSFIQAWTSGRYAR